MHGEGVFIEFNRDSIDAWLRDPELGALSQKYAQCYKEFCESKEWTVTTLRDARYVLMHTFAHLLIKQMSMSSGTLHPLFVSVFILGMICLVCCSILEVPIKKAHLVDL